VIGEARFVGVGKAYGLPARAPEAWLPFSLGRLGRRSRRHKRRTTSGAEIGRAARGRSARFNAVAGLVVLAIGLFHVWTRLEVGRLGYALSDARVLTERLDEELHELTIEFATETVPARLEQAALERVGLRPPAPGQVVILR